MYPIIPCCWVFTARVKGKIINLSEGLGCCKNNESEITVDLLLTLSTALSFHQILTGKYNSKWWYKSNVTPSHSCLHLRATENLGQNINSVKTISAHTQTWFLWCRRWGIHESQRLFYPTTFVTNPCISLCWISGRQTVAYLSIWKTDSHLGDWWCGMQHFCTCLL